MRLAMVNLTGGGLSGGYRKYLQKLLPLLQKQPGIDELSVYMPPQMEGCFNLDKTTFLSWPNSDHKRGFTSIKEQIRKASPDVVFIPTARYVNFGHIPTVIMIRNMEPLSIPFGQNPFVEAIRNLGRAYTAKRASLRADRIISVSKYVKEFLVRQWRININCIGVVYHGVELPNGVSPVKIPDCLKSLQHEKIIFTAGSIRPARGLEDLLLAFGSIYQSNPSLKLVIAGSTDPCMESYKSKLDAMATKLGITSNVIWAGALSESGMSWCYQNCSAFLVTSRAEACPNVVLEAMAHGCICISTEAPPMPEFFEDVAVYYPPKDWKALGEAIIDVLSWNNKKRCKVSEQARNRASQFSWDICAEKTVAELKMAMEHFVHKRNGRQ
jgi:glycosyltransferase involved in cell wall biosynthesis